ncbi:MAG: 1-acyl-sn-glycerol-3-phosphate acyltransferase [Chloroflexi bacterium]|nr:1-acyl-sn-glycerol-3-phosphate acyltransferase [Chloroflexota bacterium]
MEDNGDAAGWRPGSITYKTSPVMYYTLWGILAVLVRILYRYKASGGENVPRTGPVILAVNHLHLLDPIVAAPAVTRKIMTLAAGKWRSNWAISLFLKAAGVIFVRRGEADREALRACFDVLSQDGALALAPEGTRSKTGGLQHGKPGIAYIAWRTNAPIVPVALWGVESIGLWKKLKRPTCRVAVGKPFRLPPSQRRPSGEELQHLTDLVMIRIGQLLPAEYRGVYAERIAAIEAGESNELDVLIPA